MAMTLGRVTITAGIAAPATESIGVSPTTTAGSLTATIALTSGTGADQANLVWSGTRTLTASASETLDLNGTTLLDAARNQVAFARIKAILIYNQSTIGALTVGGAASNPWTGPFSSTESVRAGGTYLNACADATAWPVSGGSSDQLKITNTTGSSLTYSIVIVGSNT